MRKAIALNELRDLYGRLARRYDLQHRLITAGADQRGRKLLVEHTVRPGDRVLDCGAGTGTTGILAAELAGPDGRVTLFDLCEEMLSVARRKAAEAGLRERLEFSTGDMVRLPFADAQFDVVLSTYSLCPLYDPEQGARELYRVTRAGGRLGVAHSTEPAGRMVRWLADRVEDWAWHFPGLSMGCRSVEVLPALERAGGKVVWSRRIGVPLWPFLVFVVEKPAGTAES